MYVIPHSCLLVLANADNSADYEFFSTERLARHHQCSHQAAFSELETYVRREAPQLLQRELEGLEPELKTIINEKLKSKLAEVLPRLQLRLIDDFRNSGTTQPATADISRQEGHDQSENHLADTWDPLDFFGSMDWGSFPECDFDVAILQHQPEGSSTGSSVQHSSPTTSHVGISAEKSRDSGYGSSNTTERERSEADPAHGSWIGTFSSFV